MTAQNKGSVNDDLLARLRAVLDEVETESSACLFAADPVGWLHADRLRSVEATREVLDRHKPWADAQLCVHCLDGRGDSQPWPCPDVLTEAKRWGVES